MLHIIDQIVKKHTAIKKVHVFSDGPSSQFKDKYTAHFLHQLSVQIEWHYFATSHGKGVVNGIGGTVKRIVWNAVSTRQVHSVQDAKTFAEAAKSISKAINVTYLSQEQIDKTAHSLCLKKCFTSAPLLKGISQCHSLQPLENGLVRCRSYSIQSTWEDKGRELSVADSVETSIQSEHGGDTNSDVSEMHYVCTSSDDGKSTADADERNNSQGNDTDEVNDHADVRKKSPLSEKHNIKIEMGLPDGILPLFNQSIKFMFPHHLECYVNAVFDGSIKFQGASLISSEDLKALIGASSLKNPKDNWFSNFVIDEYLSLLKAECA